MSRVAGFFFGTIFYIFGIVYVVGVAALYAQGDRSMELWTGSAWAAFHFSLGTLAVSWKPAQIAARSVATNNGTER